MKNGLWLLVHVETSICEVLNRELASVRVFGPSHMANVLQKQNFSVIQLGGLGENRGIWNALIMRPRDEEYRKTTAFQKGYHVVPLHHPPDARNDGRRFHLGSLGLQPSDGILV